MMGVVGNGGSERLDMWSEFAPDPIVGDSSSVCGWSDQSWVI